MVVFSQGFPGGFEVHTPKHRTRTYGKALVPVPVHLHFHVTERVRYVYEKKQYHGLIECYGSAAFKIVVVFPARFTCLRVGVHVPSLPIQDDAAVARGPRGAFTELDRDLTGRRYRILRRLRCEGIDDHGRLLTR